MKKVLIHYEILYPGWFGPKKLESSEIVSFDGDVGDAIQADLLKWKNEYASERISISVKDYKII